MWSLLSYFALVAIFLLPSLVVGFGIFFTENLPQSVRLAIFSVTPMLAVLTYLLVPSLLSRLAQVGIVSGKFPRDPTHKVYGRRKLYGICWTSIYYFKPFYWLVLSVPALKGLVFRLFGYKGSLDFAAYPDTWIRDLPILSIGEKAYLSNRATIGTNICLNDGSIFVDSVHIGDRTLVGHLAMVAPGCQLEEDVEIGVGVAFGIRAKAKKGARVNPTAAINHGAVIGENAVVGSHSYVGLKAHIGPNVKVPPGSNIPAGAVIRDQADMDRLTLVDNRKLAELKDELLGIVWGGRGMSASI